VIEEVHALSFPHVIPQLVAVVHWNMEEVDMGQDFQVQLVASMGEESEKIYNQNFTATHPRHRTMLGFVGFPINAAGTHTIELKLNGAHKATHEIFAQVSVAPLIPMIQPT